MIKIIANFNEKAVRNIGAKYFLKTIKHRRTYITFK